MAVTSFLTILLSVLVWQYATLFTFKKFGYYFTSNKQFILSLIPFWGIYYMLYKI